MYAVRVTSNHAKEDKGPGMAYPLCLRLCLAVSMGSMNSRYVKKWMHIHGGGKWVLPLPVGCLQPLSLVLLSPLGEPTQES